MLLHKNEQDQNRKNDVKNEQKIVLQMELKTESQSLSPPRYQGFSGINALHLQPTLLRKKFPHQVF